MKTVNLQQGTPEWHEFRAKHFTASNASVVMGKSPYKKRQQLLKEIALGLTEEVTPAQQHLFDKGHAAEAAARPIAEDIIGDDLFPVVGISEDNELLAASFDGITMNQKITWEHKLWNQKKADVVMSGFCPEADFWQVQHQLFVSNADECLYMVSDGTPDNCEYTIVTSCSDSQMQLVAAWDRFAEDLANYVHEEAPEEVTGQSITDVPALNIQVTGAVTISNMPEFKAAALELIGSINRELETDQDFADAEQAVKWCEGVESKLKDKKADILAQTADIDELFKTLDEVTKEAREARLELNRLIKAKKELIRSNIIKDAKQQLDEHITQINEILGDMVSLPPITADFAGAMKNKRKLEAMKDAVADELAKGKIEASQIGDKMKINLDLLKKQSQGYEFLFRDAAQIIMKEKDDLEAAIKVRIADHKEQEAQKAQASTEIPNIPEVEQPKIAAKSRDDEWDEPQATFRGAILEWQQKHRVSSEGIKELFVIISTFTSGAI